MKRRRRNPVSIKDIPVLAELSGIHVTSNPARVLWALKAGHDISRTRTEGRHGDLYSSGLYFSHFPDIWMGRAYEKWDFLGKLTKRQRRALTNVLKKELHEERRTCYITQPEYERALERLDLFERTGNAGSVLAVADQPYNIAFWKPSYLDPLGIEQAKMPIQVGVLACGKFADLTDVPLSVELTDELKRRGFDGATTEATWSRVQQSVVWNTDAIKQFGNFRQNKGAAMKRRRNPLTLHEVKNMLFDIRKDARTVFRERKHGNHLLALEFAHGTMADIGDALLFGREALDTPEGEPYKMELEALHRQLSEIEYFLHHNIKSLVKGAIPKGMTEEGFAYNPRRRKKGLRHEARGLRSCPSHLRSHASRLSHRNPGILESLAAGAAGGTAFFVTKHYLERNARKRKRNTRRGCATNPMTSREARMVLDKARLHLAEAEELLETDPHNAEEEAYTAVGLLDSIQMTVPSTEKRMEAASLKRIAHTIIDEADELQGRTNPKRQRRRPDKKIIKRIKYRR